MTSYGVADLRAHVGPDAIIVGESDARFDKVRSLKDADASTLAWIKVKLADRQSVLDSTSAGFIIAPRDIDPTRAVAAGRCVALVDNPKLAFTRVVRALFLSPSLAAGIHPSAVIAKGAEIAADVRVEPGAIIGCARIGAGSVIGARAMIGDGVTLGRNVVVGPGASVGVEGFGYTRDESGEWQHFPHLGTVVIEDDVAIGAHTCVVRGSLGDTVVERGAKIDNLVSIGHNSRIGARALIAANSVVGGSAVVEADAWLSPLAVVLNGVHVGARAVVGAGVVASKNVEESTTLVAPPARPLPKSLGGRLPFG
jgi:UDP-3-O-[3-hydroxymyristoyl] glucosamine N-acyltransferase